jgi:hypothetical protein
MKRILVTGGAGFLALRLCVDHFFTDSKLVFMPRPTDDPMQCQYDISLAHIKSRAFR